MCHATCSLPNDRCVLFWFRFVTWVDSAAAGDNSELATANAREPPQLHSKLFFCTFHKHDVILSTSTLDSSDECHGVARWVERYVREHNVSEPSTSILAHHMHFTRSRTPLRSAVQTRCSLQPSYVDSVSRSKS